MGCDRPDDPKCEEGRIVSVALSSSAAMGSLGMNVEIGTATNIDNGYEISYARIGPSMGLGASASLEVAVQVGSLDSFLGQPSEGVGQAGEFELSVGALSANVPIDLGNNWKPLGGGFNVGGGMYQGLNFVGGTWASAPRKPDSARLQRCTSMAVGLAPTC